MSAAWAGSSAGVILIGTCAVLLFFAGRHAHRLHQRVQPAVYRLIIFGMYVGGCATALTPLGGWVIGVERTVAGIAGNINVGTPHEILLIGGVFMFLAALLGFLLEPGPAVAWFALTVPFVVALSGGHLHGLLTIFPAGEWSAQVSSWIGG